MPKIDLAALRVLTGTGYLPPYDQVVAGRSRVEIGKAGGLKAFGANIVTLQPGAWSSQRHWHSAEDELVVMLTGVAVLVEDGGETELHPGDCATFKAGVADGHHLQNRGDAPCSFVAVGPDLPALDECHYPDIDMFWSDGTGFIPKSAV